MIVRWHWTVAVFNDRKEQKGRNDGVDLDLDLGSAAAQIALDTTTRLG